MDRRALAVMGNSKEKCEPSHVDIFSLQQHTKCRMDYCMGVSRECLPWSGWVNRKTWLLPRMILVPVLSSSSSVISWPLTKVWLSPWGMILTTPAGTEKHNAAMDVRNRSCQQPWYANKLRVSYSFYIVYYKVKKTINAIVQQWLC